MLRVTLAALFGAVIGLKLGGAIPASWWLVLAPLWVPLALAVALVLIGLGALGVIIAVQVCDGRDGAA